MYRIVTMTRLRQITLLSFLFVSTALIVLYFVKENRTTHGPRLSFTTKHHDFGEISENTNGPLIFTFPFVNRGDATLTVNLIKTSCRCAVVELAKTAIPPGEKGQLTIRYDIMKRKPDVQKSTVFVKSNDTKNPIQLLTTAAKVHVPIYVDPKEIQGIIYPGRFYKTRIKIVGTAVEERKEFVESIDSRNSTLHFRVLETDGKKNAIRVETMHPVPVSGLRDTIVLRTSLPESPVIEIPVHVRVKERLRIKPSRAFFGRISPRQSVSQRMELVANYGEKSKIVNIRCEDAGIECRLVDNGNTLLEVTCNGSTRELGRYKGNIIIETNDVYEKQIEIPFWVWIAADEKAPL